MLILLIKSSLVVVVLLAFYKLVLERESFFAVNRYYLLSAIVLTFLIPFLVLPKLMENQGYVDTLLNEVSVLSQPTTPLSEKTLNRDAKPKANVPNIFTKIKPNQTSEAKTLQVTKSPPSITPTQKQSSKGILFWVFGIYAFGVIVLSLNLFGQVISVMRKVFKNDDKVEDENIIIVNMATEDEPCSFFNYIFINPTLYDYETYEQIIAHEKIHVDKKHSLDLLFSELAVIALWFNPFIWILRNAIKNNIEFQTDDEMVHMQNQERKSYQMSLVKLACKTAPLSITTNYNQSLIKQRIMKMNSKRSNKFNYWKYAFAMPVLLLLLLVLNKPVDAIAKTIESPITIEESISQPISEAEQVPEKIKNTASNKPNNSISSASLLISDCTEFEKAVAAGDIELVKKILKTLDPNCLKIKKNKRSNLKAVKEMVANKQQSLAQQTNEKTTNKTVDNTVDQTVCDQLSKAVDDRDLNLVRNLLLEKDVRCLNVNYQETIEDIEIMQGLLSYGAVIQIDAHQIIRISDIGFRIDVADKDNECKDPSYLKLSKAIQLRDEPTIRTILLNENLSCPLGSEGIRNDFPFIKKLMKVNPNITNHNGQYITISDVASHVDLGKQKSVDKYVQSYHNHKSYDEQRSALNDIEQILNENEDEYMEPTCLGLLDAVIQNDREITIRLLNDVNPNCFHRHKTTSTINNISTTTSHVLTPLIAATKEGNIRLVETLLAGGADPNYAGDGSLTPLMHAVKAGNLSCVITLVTNKAAINATDNNNMTSLDFAIRDLNRPIIEYLKSMSGKSNRF